ncbi:MAG TPA: bacillithiol biosynthesis deacetylase BshB1 [Candidatus Polarisedimenticolaceae bacterium]
MSDAIDVLAFGAHPDDVELFCGGTMIRLAGLGYRTGVVDLTRGELATNGSPAERAREAEAAAAVMGLALRENLGLPDGFLDPSAGSPHLAPVVEAIRRLRPEVALIPWVEDRHPDHAAAGALLARAVFLAALRRFGTDPARERFAPRAVLHYEMRHRFVPSFVVDTSSAFPRKLEAIRCHASQVTPPEGSPPTLVGSPRAIEAIEARDRFRGSAIGATHGEAFRSVATLGIADPVAFFRVNPPGEAHAFEALK